MSSYGNHINSTQTNVHAANGSSLPINGFHRVLSRSRTPNIPPDHPITAQLGNAPEAEPIAEEDPRTALFRNLYARSEVQLGALFGVGDGDVGNGNTDVGRQTLKDDGKSEGPTKPTPKKAARIIDDSDYDDSDEEEEENPINASPLKNKSTGLCSIPRVASPGKLSGIPPSPALTSTQGTSSQWQGKTPDDARKQLEENKKAEQNAAKRSFHTMFYPIDNDRDAMLEQQKLEEINRQVDVEMSGTGHAAANNVTEGTLSQANLGASSLVLKHLIARIDAKREKVRASDQELRNLMIEVKKNRSKWASEEKVGQEELYEAAEKVLSEVKAMTEHSQPFLQKVNKRDAPDYYNIIRHPMDLSTMTKKLKAFQYKSKHDFVEDLKLIWTNCLKYNGSPEHFLGRHALFMRKETEKLIPLIPDIVIRDRAEVDAEERRLHSADGDIEGAEDSDDEPIISSRGRKAPGKKAKKGSNTRIAQVGGLEGTPGAETKPVIQGLHPNGSSMNPRHDFLRMDSDNAIDGSQNGLSTPPPGTITPAGLNGHVGSTTLGSQVDPMEIDAFGTSVNGASLGGVHEVDLDDNEYKTWKQVTKRDRALVAAERHRLFKGDHINPEEPALIRNKAGMRRWMRKQREAETVDVLGKRKREAGDDGEEGSSRETLAEGIDGAEERVLPDYYDTMSAIPELAKPLQWVEDSEGHVLPPSEELLRIVPKGLFTAPDSAFARKMDANMRQMQETRKVCTKIGVVKQMQLQTQMYSNQFQKYNPEPFAERDVEPAVVSDDFPIISSSVSRAAMQRSVAKVFYSVGFEEFQPSALESITDLAGEFFNKLARSVAEYVQQPRQPMVTGVPGSTEQQTGWKPKHTIEESVLQALQDNGIEIEALDSYAKDDVDRLTGKLGVLHERMKSHLADLLRPALAGDGVSDGSRVFEDNNEQFVNGDSLIMDFGEDFFGFRELGLDKEFGMMSLNVPLHLLQNRMHHAYQSTNASALPSTAVAFPTPPPYPPLTLPSIQTEIGLVQNFFLAKLHANNDEPLVEDEDLPQKQRFPKPRLGGTGKITSPRKKPMKEPGPGKGHPKKKMRMVEGEGWVKDVDNIVKDKEKEKKEGGHEKDGDPEKEKSSKAASASALLLNKNPVGGGINNQIKLTNGVTTPALNGFDLGRDRVDGDGANVNGETEADDPVALIEVKPPAVNRGMSALGKKVNGIAGGGTGEGGMISPESLEAS